MQYGLDRIQAPRSWLTARGAGVAVAIIDTGVDLDHEDLRGRLLPGRDLVDNDDFAQDANGHGTHVAGIVAAGADNGHGVIGAAPDASILPMRVLDPKGTGTESNVEAAILWAVQRTQSLGLRLVVNLSLTDVKLSGTVNSRRIQEAIRTAWFAGAVIVGAVGNDALPYVEYPASGPNVIAVGATDERDKIASFSNRGALVVAPGEKIVSTYWDPKTPGDHRLYASGTGTSMAAPFVSGMAALLLSSGLDNRETVRRIIGTADDLGPPGRDDEYGYGRINVARALGLPDLPGARPAVTGAQAPSIAGQFEEVRPSPSTRAMPVSAKKTNDKALPGATAILMLSAAYAATRVQYPRLRRRSAQSRQPWEF